MKMTAVVLICALVVLGLPAGASAQSMPAGPLCQGEVQFLNAAASVQQRGIPYFVEVEVILVNRSQTKIQMDPGRFVLVPDQGEPAGPLTLEQAVRAVRNPGQLGMGFLLFGVVGVIANAVTQDRWAKEVEARYLKAGELAPGSIVKGSVYFKFIRMTRFDLRLEGLDAETAAPLPPVQLTGCQMPARAVQPDPAASPTPQVRMIALTARATSGPVALAVSNVEFTREATVLTVTVENAAEAEANLYNALGETTLTDNTGKIYQMRMLRSDLVDRVPPRGQVRGRLVFEPLPFPPAVTSAVLTMREIRIGDDVYEIKVELRL